MEIIMRRLCFGLPFLLLTVQLVCVRESAADATGARTSASAIIREMNLARTNPARYATFIEELRSHFHGNVLVLPGRTILRTKEGVGALDDAVRFLRSAQPQTPLILSPGMCHAAADHCADQAVGRRGHGGSDWSSPGDRLNRYGKWSTRWGENISYGKSSARDIVLALIIDDGLRGRKHRKNIFNPTFSFAGAAYGPHASYRSVCSIEFAAGFAERGQGPAETLVARNP
jgi:uncharacterized protein YkwD